VECLYPLHACNEARHWIGCRYERTGRLAVQVSLARCYRPRGSVFQPKFSPENGDFEVEREACRTIYSGPRFSRKSIQKILVVKLDHLGDSVTALPAVKRLKRMFPACSITALASPSTLPFWRDQPCIDETIACEFFHARSSLGKAPFSTAKRAKLEQELRERGFDLAIDLRKQPETREILALSGARVLAGFDHQGAFPGSTWRWNGTRTFRYAPVAITLATI